ncbi:methyltransferase domain-containing protein [Candidatus Falkowbacteria bacterium]|nr:methyltransferase domain-containing protein [Candidatus Falkowbacteria bacterium]
MANLSGGHQLLDAMKILQDIGIGNGQRVADLGCGAVAHFTFPAAALVGKGGMVYAVDIRRIVLEGVTNRCRVDGIKNIQTIWSNLEIPKATGIADNSLDVALLITVLFQNNDHEPIIAEAVRMTRPGGHVVIIDWRRQQSTFGPPLDHRLDVEKILRLCQNSGITLEREFVPGPFHFGLIFKKQ